MRGVVGLLLAGFLVATLGESAPADWLSDLLANVQQSNRKLQSDLQLMDKQIDMDVNAKVAQIHQDINKQLAQAHEEVSKALKDVQEAGNVKFDGSSIQIQNAGSIITNTGDGHQSVVLSGKGGKRVVNAGTDASGKPYYNESEDLVIGDTLFHTERVYNYTTKKLEVQRYTLNLKDPNAKPVYETETNTAKS